MPTKYDVFAMIIEHAPCKAKDLQFKTPVYAHLNSLVEIGWIKKSRGLYIPVKNKSTTHAFKIIKYCLKNGLNYNKFFSKNMPLVLKEISQHIPNLRPKRLKANKENTDLMNYLENNQFILITKKRPRKGILLKHQLLKQVWELFGFENSIVTRYMNVQKKVLDLKTDEINPFDEKVFQFLSGSAQLEGSTITAGETMNLILKDIYPDKPKKDIQMVQNLNEAMYFVLKNVHKDITVKDIKKINRLVLFSLHRNAGKYKIVINKIQGNPEFKTAKPHQVPALMQKYCEILKGIKDKKECIKKIGWIHNEVQHIHPFSDGNSRTTRMILNWVLLKYQLSFLVLKMGCFDEYMALTKLAKKRDDEKLAKLFCHLLLHEDLLN